MQSSTGGQSSDSVMLTAWKLRPWPISIPNRTNPSCPTRANSSPLTEKPARRRSARVSALADNERLALTSEARADELAIDMEESVAAQTSIEKAMVHQLAAAHALALRLVGRANLEIEGMHRFDRQGQRETMVEIAKLKSPSPTTLKSAPNGLPAIAPPPIARLPFEK